MRKPPEDQLAVARPFAVAFNEAPEFREWASGCIDYTIQTAIDSGHPERVCQTVFAMAVLVGWELAQLHIEKMMKETAS